MEVKTDILPEDSKGNKGNVKRGDKKRKANVQQAKAEINSMNKNTRGEREREIGKKKKTEKEAVNSLRAYAAGIRPSSTLGETGLTNPSHSSSPGIWTAHSAPNTHTKAIEPNKIPGDFSRLHSLSQYILTER